MIEDTKIIEPSKNTLIKILDKEFGHKKSRELQMSVDSDANPIPWMTYPAIFYLEQLDLSDKNVFEWGAGNSSLFFSSRVKSIVTVELKEEWIEYVKEKRKKNLTLIHADEFNYADVILRSDKLYDLIIIDGEIYKRYDCAKYAIKRLKPTGMIVLDNSDWLSNTCEFLRKQNLIQVDMAGFGPINKYTWCTSFFITRNNNFRSLHQKQPGYVFGGLKNIRD